MEETQEGESEDIHDGAFLSPPVGLFHRTPPPASPKQFPLLAILKIS